MDQHTHHPYHSRALELRIRQLFDQFPVVVLSGARQVGKSTLLQHVFGNHMPHIIFDPVRDIEGARADPDLFLSNRQPPIILDEIQYVPELASAIKRRLEHNRKPSQYLISGSQQWQVLANLQESLAGRAVFLDLDSFSLSEINQYQPEFTGWLGKWLNNPQNNDISVLNSLKFNLLEQLWRGFLPDTQFLTQDMIPIFWQGYHRTYIERDIREVTHMTDLDLFSRFFRLVSALTAQEINYSHLGRELGINPQTASRWLNALKSTFQWFEVPAYSGNTLKRIASKSKGYLSDTGLTCFLQIISNPHMIPSHPIWGHLFETFIFLELKKQCAGLPFMPSIYHWRTNGGAEVDFIIEHNGCFTPIEVKAKSHVSNRDASGIHAFRNTYPGLNIGKGIIIFTGDTIYPVTDFATAIPWHAQ